MLARGAGGACFVDQLGNVHNLLGVPLMPYCAMLLILSKMSSSKFVNMASKQDHVGELGPGICSEIQSFLKNHPSLCYNPDSKKVGFISDCPKCNHG